MGFGKNGYIRSGERSILSLKWAKPNREKSKIRAYYTREGFLQKTNPLLFRYSQFRNAAAFF